MRGISQGARMVSQAAARGVARASAKVAGRGVHRGARVVRAPGEGMTPMTGASTSRPAASGARQARNQSGKVKVDYKEPGSEYTVRLDPSRTTQPMHVDMSGLPAKSFTKAGAPRNAEAFWSAWQKKYPNTMSRGNLHRLSEQLSPRVDAKWVASFPEHGRFMGRILEHHHLDNGTKAIPLPDLVHRLGESYKIWH